MRRGKAVYSAAHPMMDSKDVAKDFEAETADASNAILLCDAV